MFDKAGSLCLILISMVCSVGAQEWCAPPYPPEKFETAYALEWRYEIIEEYEAYLKAGTAYIACLDHERQRFWKEMHEQTQLYGQFLESSRRVPSDAGAD